MRRGDVVRTVAEFMALPVGSEALSIDGDVIQRHIHQERTGIQEAWLPALVRVVGPVEPDWLEAAAEATRGNLATAQPRQHWSEVAPDIQSIYRRMAKAAVAAADKARGIVNSREEFDALPAGTICWAWLDGEVWQLVRGPNQAMPPSRYPVVVVGGRS